MGLSNIWGAIKGAASEANEAAHGHRMRKEWFDSINKIARLDGNFRDEIIARFLDKRSKLISPMRNWTTDGKLGMVVALREDARKTLDMNMVEGYAVWMTAAWLESFARPGEDAVYVRGQLEGLAEEHQKIRLNEE